MAVSIIQPIRAYSYFVQVKKGCIITLINLYQNLINIPFIYPILMFCWSLSIIRKILVIGPRNPQFLFSFITIFYTSSNLHTNIRNLAFKSKLFIFCGNSDCICCHFHHNDWNIFLFEVIAKFIKFKWIGTIIDNELINEAKKGLV